MSHTIFDFLGAAAFRDIRNICSTKNLDFRSQATLDKH